MPRARRKVDDPQLPNRVDLGPPRANVEIRGNLPYGSRDELEAVQDSAGALQGATPQPSGGGPGGQPPDLANVLALARAAAGPGVPLGAPSMRPNEPVTAGVDVGPGAGSEALGRRPRRLSQRLAFMADYTDDIYIRGLADRAAQLGY